MDAGDVSEELVRLEEETARSGMRIAVDHVEGHRRGVLRTDDLGESVFVLHATGRDEGTAVRAREACEMTVIDRLEALEDCSHREPGS